MTKSDFILRFIASLLDPNEQHYKDDKCLEKLLEICDLNGFIDTKNAKVLREHQNIDIFIRNDESAIIIENKICAGDACNKNRPSKQSLGAFIISDDKKIIDNH
ncbi:MAG: PD-(D/E)XK nuclease family protein [Campylobacter sp.]